MLQWNEKRIEEMIRGDIKAQECCYREFSPLIYTAILKICKNRTSASDLLQDTFINAFEYIEQYNSNFAFIAWLKRIAFNNTFNFIKREKVAENAVEYLKEVPSEYPSFSDDICQQNLLESLLDKISENERLILWLFIVEQYSHEEIARLVDRTPSYSKSIVSRSLKKLKSYSEEKSYVYR